MFPLRSVINNRNIIESATLGLVNILFYLFFIEMRLNFTTHLQMVLGPVFVDDQVLAPSGIYGMP